MRGLGNKVSGTFIKLMVLLGTFGVGLWALGFIASLAGRSGVTAPIGAVATRYRRFAQTGG